MLEKHNPIDPGLPDEITIICYFPASAGVTSMTLGDWTVPARIKDGLAVHKRLAREGDGWVVSHVSSGRSIAWGLETFAAAWAALEAALPLADWTQGESELLTEIRGKYLHISATMQAAAVLQASKAGEGE